MLPRVTTLVSLADVDGVPGASFRDEHDNELRLALPADGAPLLQRCVPHRYTDKFTGDHHAYATREDTPLSWEDAARLLDALAPFAPGGTDALRDELARRARADVDPALQALLDSTSEVLFPAQSGKRLVTPASRAEDGDSPLHVLLWRGDGDGARALIAAGADVDAPGDLGDTPLHVALRKQLPDAVAALLAAGADPDRPNTFGQSPREAARKAGGALADWFPDASPSPD